MKRYFLRIIFLGIFSFIFGMGASYITYGVRNSNFYLVSRINQDFEYKNSASVFRSIMVNVSRTTDTSRDKEDGSLKINTVLNSPSGTIRIGFVGDIIPGKNAPTDFFDEVLSYTHRPDIMIGNFEGSIASNEYSKCKTGNNKCFSFNGDDKFIGLLSKASFDVLNISNNHFNDYGKDGMEETIRKIQNSDILPVGIKDKIVYINKNNLKVGVVSFSTSWWAESMNDEINVKKRINEASVNSDIVVVIFHAGAEGVKYSHTPNDTEWYLGENRGNVRLFSHMAVDAGADIVFGTGPHVLRGMEKYKDKLIAYSLGNFASASDKLLNAGSLKTSAMIEIVLDKEGSFVSGNIFPLELNDLLHPHKDSQGLAISFMNDLSKSDFGNNAVLIEESGEIIFK